MLESQLIERHATLEATILQADHHTSSTTKSPSGGHPSQNGYQWRADILPVVQQIKNPSYYNSAVTSHTHIPKPLNTSLPAPPAVDHNNNSSDGFASALPLADSKNGHHANGEGDDKLNSTPSPSLSSSPLRVSSFRGRTKGGLPLRLPRSSGLFCAVLSQWIRQMEQRMLRGVWWQWKVAGERGTAALRRLVESRAGALRAMREGWHRWIHAVLLARLERVTQELRDAEEKVGHGAEPHPANAHTLTLAFLFLCACRCCSA